MCADTSPCSRNRDKALAHTPAIAQRGLRHLACGVCYEFSQHSSITVYSRRASNTEDNSRTSEVIRVSRRSPIREVLRRRGDQEAGILHNGITGDDRQVDPLQPLGWVDPEALTHHLLHGVVQLERLAGPAAPVQREHVLRPEALDERVLRAQCGQLAEQL